MRVRPRAAWRTLAIVLAAAYWLVLFAATHMPLATHSGLGGVKHQDKVAHLLAFAALGFVATAAASTIVTPRGALYAGILAAIGTYAALDEWTQQWIARRSPDVADWLADVAGASLGIAAFAVLLRFIPSLASASHREGEAPAEP